MRVVGGVAAMPDQQHFARQPFQAHGLQNAVGQIGFFAQGEWPFTVPQCPLAGDRPIVYRMRFGFQTKGFTQQFGGVTQPGCFDHAE